MKECAPVVDTRKSQDRKHDDRMRRNVVVSSKRETVEKNGEGEEWQKKRRYWTRWWSGSGGRIQTVPTVPRQIVMFTLHITACQCTVTAAWFKNEVAGDYKLDWEKEMARWWTSWGVRRPERLTQKWRYIYLHHHSPLYYVCLGWTTQSVLQVLVGINPVQRRSVHE